MRNFLSQCFGFADSKHTVSYAKQEQPSTLIEELCHRFSLAQLRKATNNFDESQIIGTGGFCPVYKGCILVNDEAKEVAIRRAHSKNESKNEIVFLCQLHHSNLVSLIGFCDDKNEIFVVYEYLSNGSLHDHLHQTGNYKLAPPLSWKKRLEICIGAARGLHYLHTGAKYTIFHRDVKPTNILLDENWVPKIVGLGLCLRGPIFTTKHPKPIEVASICGTFGYMEPEYALFGKVTEKTDVYSFGMVLLEVACAKRPWEMLMEMTVDDRNEDDGEMTVDERNKNESEMTVDDRNKDESESECSYSSWTSERPDHSIRTGVKKIIQKAYANEIIDPFLKGKIAPECWNLFKDIADRCVLEEPTERPAMGEVELELERALQLQEEADAKLTSGCEHNLVCTTSITFQPQQPNNEGVATHSEINPC